MFLPRNLNHSPHRSRQGTGRPGTWRGDKLPRWPWHGKRLPHTCCSPQGSPCPERTPAHKTSRGVTNYICITPWRGPGKWPPRMCCSFLGSPATTRSRSQRGSFATSGGVDQSICMHRLGSSVLRTPGSRTMRERGE